MNPNADKVGIAAGLKIKWAGTLDIGDFYTKTKLWFSHNGYGDEARNFKEAKYVQKVKATGKDIELKWIGSKKVSDYFENQIILTMVITKLNDTESVVRGKKVKMNSASMDIKLNADLVKNRSGKWKKDSLMKKIYEKFIIKDRIDEYSMALFTEIYTLHDEIKTYLGLHRL